LLQCLVFSSEGLEGFLAKLGCSDGSVCFANVPYSEVVA